MKTRPANSMTARALVAYSVLADVFLVRGCSEEGLRALADKIATDDPACIYNTLRDRRLTPSKATKLSYAIKEAWLGLAPLEPDEPVVAPPVAFRGLSPRQAKVYDMLREDWWWSHGRQQDEIREAAEQIGDADSDDLHDVTRDVIGSHEGWDNLRDKVEEALRLDTIDRQQAALELYAD